MTAILRDETKKLILPMTGEMESQTVTSRVLGKTIPLKNGFATQNAEAAAEIAERYDGRVVVANAPTRRPSAARTLFVMPELPWKKEQHGEETECKEVDTEGLEERGAA